MESSTGRKIVAHLRQVALRREALAELDDGALLCLFIQQRDEAAFARLVQRHGPMVLAVCRRILGNCHDADDAFQATFLVLVRKAAHVQPPGLIGNWLHGVACRTAQEARRLSVKRHCKERAAAKSERIEPEAERDWHSLLDRELQALPDRYRSAIVLCDLGGQTQKEAARQLRCPEGTLAGRLSRGRDLLAKRLSRRGVTITSGGLAAFLAENAQAAVPRELTANILSAASLGAAGRASAVVGAISPQVALLAERVVHAMYPARMIAAMLVCLVAVGLGLWAASLMNAGAPPSDRPGQPPGSSAQEKPGTEKLARKKEPISEKAEPGAKEAPARVKPSDEVLRNLHANKGWHDGSSSDVKPAWQPIPQEGDEEAGGKIQFPAVAKGWFNIYLPVREGSWPQGGGRMLLRARADRAARVYVRLNEMPGATEGKMDRHEEFEAHVVEFSVGKEWADVDVDLRQAVKLWGHAAGNGKLDFERITGVGFEPVDVKQPLTLEVRMIRVVPAASTSPKREQGTGSTSPKREQGKDQPEAPARDTNRGAVDNRTKHRIVFNSDRDGNYEIYAMDADGRNLDRLTNHAAFDLWPAPSPDGKKIAWMTNRDGNYEIYVMNADGSNPVNISKSPQSEEGHPTWSPDGKRIAFSSDRDGDMELYLMDADGTNWKRLTHSKGSDGLPSFSPDGKQIVFVSERDGDHELYLINVDGTGSKRLTKRKGLDTMPAWSPDGKTIAFVSDQGGEQAIFLMDPDGGNVRRLKGPTGFAAWPDWSPDGKAICYHSMIGAHFTICTVDVATGKVDELTRYRGANRNPRFALLAEDQSAPPAIPSGGIRLAATVSGWLRSGAGGPNPQKYPFKYTGYAVLDKHVITILDAASAVKLDRPVPAAPSLGRAVGQALSWPGAGDIVEEVHFNHDGERIIGHVKILHRYGKQGTHTIKTYIEGSWSKGKLTLKASRPSIDGTWDWGGGIARQEGEVTITFEVQTADHNMPHTHPSSPVDKKTPLGLDPPAKKELGKEPDSKGPPATQEPGKGGLKLTAVVDGHTQATMFNQQKYPFQYTGTSIIDAEQLRALSKAGDVPESAAKALLSCLLWPRADDSFGKILLKSDGKKLTGEVEVQHKYGKQGTHTLKMRLEGTVDNGAVTLRALEPTVTGTWDYGSGMVKLGGEVKITFK